MNFPTQKAVSIRHQVPYLPSTSVKKMAMLLVMSLTANLLLAIQTWAFEINTHEQLTEDAIITVQSTLNTYLIDNLGLEGGLDASIEGGTPRDLMKKGSRDEDTEAFALRVLNHFHEPLFHGGLLWGVSAIEWSLKALGSQAPGGQWSWNDARDYYFKALTSETKSERDKYWGMTFEALGHVMHLIQDMASPAHVRNDDHLSLSGFGDVDGLHDYMARRGVFGNIGPDPSILQQAGAVRPEPFSNLFDQNAYDGENPNATLGPQAGLAEYANANFFSDDTIPGQDIFFPNYTYPAIEELVPVGPVSAYLTLPRLGHAASPSARAAKFTGNQAVAKFLLTNTNLDLLGQLQLDDAVYDAQSRHLIPRAVGYSAAVLEYFFRGELPVIEHDFIFVGTFTPDSPDCGLPTDPPGADGFLQVGISIPPDLNFSEGTASLYYEKSDGSRALGGQVDLPLPFPPFDKLGIGVEIPQADVLPDPAPVRWYMVLEGMAGPGVREKRAILANTDKATRRYFCLG